MYRKYIYGYVRNVFILDDEIKWKLECGRRERRNKENDKFVKCNKYECEWIFIYDDKNENIYIGEINYSFLFR